MLVTSISDRWTFGQLFWSLYIHNAATRRVRSGPTRAQNASFRLRMCLSGVWSSERCSKFLKSNPKPEIWGPWIGLSGENDKKIQLFIKYMDLYSASSWTTSNALPFPVSRRWSPQANPTAKHHRTLRDHVIRVGAPRDMPVYFPAFAGTKLYCLVTEAVGCEQLA